MSNLRVISLRYSSTQWIVSLHVGLQPLVCQVHSTRSICSNTFHSLSITPAPELALKCFLLQIIKNKVLSHFWTATTVALCWNIKVMANWQSIHMSTMCCYFLLFVFSSSIKNTLKHDSYSDPLKACKLTNQIKSNHFYCHITTAQVPWWVKFLRACSRQCRKTKQFTYRQYIFTDCTEDNVQNTHTHTQYTL